MTPKQSKIFNIFFFVRLLYFSNRFGIRMLAKVQQREYLIQWAFKGVIADFCLKIGSKLTTKFDNVKILVDFRHFQLVFT